jgi:hypothetical protein
MYLKYIIKSTFFFFFFWYWVLNSGPSPWVTPPTLFLKSEGFFEIGFCGTICLDWLWTVILLISASWVVRITGVSHRHLDQKYFLMWSWSFMYSSLMDGIVSFSIVLFSFLWLWQNAWDSQLLRRKDLFLLISLEVSGHEHLALLVWGLWWGRASWQGACGGAKLPHYGQEAKKVREEEAGVPISP